MGHIFINVNSDGPPTGWNRSQNAQKYLVLDLASQHNTSQQPQYAPLPAASFPSVSSQYSTSMPASVPIFPRVPVVDVNNLPGMVDCFLDLYYRRFGHDKTSTDLLQPGTECGGWRSLLPQWVGQSPILDIAIGALAASFIGAQYQDSNLINQARDMYLNALQRVQKVLPEHNSAERSDLLATTLVMSSIELFMSNGGSASQLTHIEGATRLLGCAFETSNFEELHLYILNQGLFESISRRRPYQFASPKYQPTMRQLFSVPRTHGSDLYFQWCEINLPLPNILHAVDNLLSSSSQSARILLSDINTLEQNLKQWYETLRSQVPGPWTLPAAQTSPSRVPFPLHFLSIEVCTLFSLYWTTQVLLLDAKHTIYTSAASSSSSPMPSDASLPTQISEYASLVCRSVQFCTQGTSFAATENMLMPLCVVVGFYMRQGDEERAGWCVGAFRRISEEQRIGFAVETLGL
jgi:hypothetical protein